MKRILCLFAALLLFAGILFALEQDNFLYFVRKSSADIRIKQTEYSKNSLAQTEQEKEISFKKLYINYIDYYKNISKYYVDNSGISFDFDFNYVKNHKDEYKKYGIGFNIPEFNWEPEEDYTMLLNTPDIPENWSEWLKLQQKYVSKNRKNCLKMYLRSTGCEGGTMTIPEREQAIVDLSKIEQKSDVIKSIKSPDFDYIPFTSKELLYTYLLGNDLKPIFEWDYRNDKSTSRLNKTSKKSFEHFIKYHSDSIYYDLVSEYYNRLKQNNFADTNETTDWLLKELEKIN